MSFSGWVMLRPVTLAYTTSIEGELIFTAALRVCFAPGQSFDRNLLLLVASVIVAGGSLIGTPVLKFRVNNPLPPFLQMKVTPRLSH